MEEPHRESEDAGLPAREETGPDYCRYCGEEIPDRACQCPECGRRIDPAEAPSVEQVNRRNMPGLVLLAIYSAVVAIFTIVTTFTSLLNALLAPPVGNTTPAMLIVLIGVIGWAGAGTCFVNTWGLWQLRPWALKSARVAFAILVVFDLLLILVTLDETPIIIQSVIFIILNTVAFLYIQRRGLAIIGKDLPPWELR